MPDLLLALSVVQATFLRTKAFLDRFAVHTILLGINYIVW